ncbi:MAG: hypothetical protein U1F98_01035 [Verrucomicrobiota bacterium]
MKPLIIGLLGAVVSLRSVRADDITMFLMEPGANAIVGDNVHVVETGYSTYSLQGIQATLADRSVSLVYTTAAYRDKTYTWIAGWTNDLSLVGIPRGTNILTVTATDVFGTAQQVQQRVMVARPPQIAVNEWTNGIVVRPVVHVEASTATEDPAGCTLTVFTVPWYPDNLVDVGPTLLSGSNAVSGDLSLSSNDSQLVTLGFQAIDSIHLGSRAYRQVYVQSSTNLVEIDHVSQGILYAASSDRLLFEDAGNLRLRSRTDGTESLVYGHAGKDLVSAFLAPTGAVFQLHGTNWHNDVHAYAIELAHDGVGTELSYLTSWQPAHLELKAAGRYAAWGGLDWVDLETTNVIHLGPFPESTAVHFDIAPNGDLVYAPQPGGSIFRYRGGVSQVIITDSTNALSYPKIDGTNIGYIKTLPSSQALMLRAGTVDIKAAEASKIGTNFLISNGWLAYEANSAGVMQVWRRSPDGVATQLSYWGTASHLLGLAPNGQVIFSSPTSRLCLSKGTWPPYDIGAYNASGGLIPFWQDGRWEAFLGRSLFQISTGVPDVADCSLTSSHEFYFEVVAALGQRVVTEASADLAHWSPVATNVVVDGAPSVVKEPLQSGTAARYYRVHAQ